MKTSTLMTTVLLSASCFAAPVRTAQDSPIDQASARIPLQSGSPADDAPVAPPAPNVPITGTDGPQHWEYLSLPRSHRLDKTLSPDLHQQT
ncbi:hypothetical protein [Paraburkholderia lycopersici]|uniref:Uncharacterized protein n=1 Tax=Paraburkholderia lycopersici TaxID=416944 RepID=A0A1G6UPN5_9BURK|nr:hypothetical protein [Paraburkholderia lycopersici]SDD43390.1 hypothetical protein SAMN05421548_11980 [Paraburkholderia lycopersici]